MGRMIKQLFSLSLVLVFLFCMMPVSASAADAKVTTILSNVEVAGGWQQTDINTSNWGGSLDVTALKEGGYFAVNFTGESIWQVYLCLNAPWTQIAHEASTFTVLEDGSYLTTFSFDECTAAYGASDLSGLGSVALIINSDSSGAGATIKSFTYVSPASEPEVAPEATAGTTLFTGSTVVSSNWSVAWDMLTTKAGGTLDATTIVEDSYFVVCYTGISGKVYFAMQDATAWGWYSASPSYTKAHGDGYVSVFSYATLASAFGTSDFSDLGKIVVGTQDPSTDTTFTRVGFYTPGTTQETTQDTQETTQDTQETTQDTQETTQDTQETTQDTQETTQDTQETTQDTQETTQDTQETTQDTQETTQDTQETTQDTQETTQDTQETTQDTQETTQATQETTGSTGSNLITAPATQENAWSIVLSVSTTNDGGTFDPAEMKNGGSFSVTYTGTEGALYMAIQDAGTWSWCQVDAPSTTVKNADGSYTSTFTSEALAAVYKGAADFSDLGKVFVGTGNAEGATVITGLVWNAASGEGEPETEPQATNTQLNFNDASWWPGTGDNPVTGYVSGPGTYTMTWSLGNDYWNNPAEGVVTFYIDVIGGATMLRNCKLTELTITADGVNIPVDLSKVVTGDPEYKGNYRIEIYNEWGNTKNDPPIDASLLNFSKELTVTFTLYEPPTDSGNADTGDSFNPALILLMLVSGIALGVVLSKRKSYLA